ncbi:MAG: 4-alpha-glucanotransferase [Candidatus Sumerlaeota bacterium]
MRFESLIGRDKASLVLLHPTSLPDPQGRTYGIGEIGSAAADFLQRLLESDTLAWQVLPLGHIGYGDSPYQTFSRFAGNPLLISIEYLLRDGDLSEDEHDAYCDKALSLDRTRVDYGWIFENKLGAGPEATGAILRKAFQRFSGRTATDKRVRAFYAFRERHRQLDGRGWLADYADFMAIKENYDLRPWHDWPDKFCNIEHYRSNRHDILHEHPGIDDSITFYEYLQFVFFQQWDELRAKAAKLQRKIIGDMPWYVGYDSADVWANPDVFELDEEGNRKALAGVPPDAFSDTGQLWGNPLYNWGSPETIRWWAESLGQVLSRVDILRLDHFRAVDTYWSVPCEWVEEHDNAMGGHWEKGPGEELLEAVRVELERADLITGDEPLPIIAEDLGNFDPIYASPEAYPEDIEDKNRFEVAESFAERIRSGDDTLGEALNTETGEYDTRKGVDELLEKFALPWMGVLQFAFQGADKYLPDRMPRLSVTYTGTHDNDTTAGWYCEQRAAEEKERQKEKEEEKEKKQNETTEDKAPLHERICEALYGESCDDPPEEAEAIAHEMIRLALHSDSVLAGCPMQDLLQLDSEARMNKPGDNDHQWWAWRMEPEQASNFDLWEQLSEWNRKAERLAKVPEV